MSKLSILIPSRNEKYLYPTIRDCFAKSQGEVEVVVTLDGYWPDGWKEMTDTYPNLHTVHHGEARGMRPAINAAAASAISRGAKYLFKLDAHCMLDEGFDVKLQADMDHDWIVVPRRKRLDAENWTLQDVGKPDIDYHYLSFPDDPDDWGGPGLNGKPWTQRVLDRKGKPEFNVDDEMSSQGSAWGCHADYFTKLELMDTDAYGPFWNEAQELFLKCWLSGGRGVINKKTWYAHLRKGKDYEGTDGKKGRGYTLPESWLTKGRNQTMNWIWNEAWPKQTLPFKWLIEHFWPVPSWPDNWEEVLYATRKPRDVVSMAGSGSANATDGNSPTGKQGLIIYSAYYGIGPHVGEFMDVTQQLRSLVKDSSLDIVVNNSTLTPNQNLFRGKKKHLIVVYSIDKSEDTVRRVEEKDWLIIGPVAQSNVPAMVSASVQTVRDTLQLLGVEAMQPKEVLPPMTAAALNDYLIRKFSISPQRLRGPMPIELRDFHRNDLAQLFAKLGFKRGAEIGVAEGNYSEVLLKANPECELLLVDPWHHYSDNPQGKSKEKYEFAYVEMVRKTMGYQHVKVATKYSMDAVRDVEDNLLDFVYLDAHHSYPFIMEDLINWTRKVRSGGIVAGDDAFKLDEKRWGAGPMEAIYDYTRAMRINPWWLINAHKSVDFFFVKL